MVQGSPETLDEILSRYRALPSIEILVFALFNRSVQSEDVDWLS